MFGVQRLWAWGGFAEADDVVSVDRVYAAHPQQRVRSAMRIATVINFSILCYLRARKATVLAKRIMGLWKRKSLPREKEETTTTAKAVKENRERK